MIFFILIYSKEELRIYLYFRKVFHYTFSLKQIGQGSTNTWFIGK